MNGIDISIIIATRNREEVLLQTLEKACVATENTNAEIIAVNDGDIDLKIPQELFDKINLINNPKRGVTSARNLGADRANGSILFFVDDDMWINREIIDWINNFMMKPGNFESVYNINWEYPDTLNKELRTGKIGKYILKHNYNSMWGRMHQPGNEPKNGLYLFHGISSCSLVMSKMAFHKIGQYNEEMIFQGEDIDLANKINAHAIPIYCVFDATLHHNHRDRLEIDSFLNRNAEGFYSEFSAVKSGLIKPLSDIKYDGIKKQMFRLFSYTEKGWVFLLKIFPNNFFFNALNNRLIGFLESLQRYKQWKRIIG